MIKISLQRLFALLALFASLQTFAQNEESEYVAPAGAPFFLLTDTSFGSQEESRVRLEINQSDFSLLTETGGVDVALYRVKDPLSFLKQQKNLHRINLQAAARSEGLGNALSFLWDGAWKKARALWQSLFSVELRKKVTDQAPQLAAHADSKRPPPYLHAPAYQAPAGMETALRFRYPVQYAKPIAAPKDLTLPGSSSNFTPTAPGNIYIPLGKQKPGLYVVEAAVGKHRAVALLFVGDAVAVSKTSPEQMLVWVAQRQGGKPAAKAALVWSDLSGVLASGKTDDNGVAVFKRKVPETSYMFGADAQGGVFISENFYYDSEIYNNKIYATTDRPLYRPGDEVNIKIVGREFTGARSSKPMAAATLGLTVLDAQGNPVHSAQVAYQLQSGGDSRFTLPQQAPAGGYEIRITRGDDQYSAAFRVAQYVKPHFEILIEADKPSFKTGEAIGGQLRLAYPDGKPVANAVVSLSARAQVLTMVEGDLAYGGAFPVQIDNNQELRTDSKGMASFKLPPAKEPSRLVLSVLATDGAIQRVRATQQLLIERAANAWLLRPDQQFAAPGESIAWKLAPAESSAPTNTASLPTRWVALHQESRSSTQGTLDASSGSLQLKLERSGSYTVQLRDAQDQLVAAAPFFVTGSELKPPLGAIEIVLDKPRYRAGDIARALITFPEVVDDALITLERDSVEQYGRLLAPGRIAEMRRINERQWEARIRVDAQFAPNITLSAAYVKGQNFGFQNAGIAVEQLSLQISLKTDKAIYLPGDTVTVDIETKAQGQGVAASVSLGAVDEMVYVLQSEIAPSIQEFFYHPRRNNVRTHSSLAFISYDEAAAPGLSPPRSRSTQERGIKLLERPRRDERDTAYWSGNITTDAQGRARISFTVPDALTRWRLTARGFALGKADGLVGERRAYFQSDKPVYAKWTSPDWLRKGDLARVSLAVFNQEKAPRDVQVHLGGIPRPQTQSLKLMPGANFVSFSLEELKANTELSIKILQGNTPLDALQTRLQVLPTEWPSAREALISVAAGQGQIALNLPTDSSNLRLRPLSEGAAAWYNVADSLVDYPYGCLEQTASRLIPLALALRAMPGSEATSAPLRQRLYASRLRLAALAGPNAAFGWWGSSTGSSAFLSAYAYYADYLATQTLGMALPSEHWQQLIEIYSKEHRQESLAHRALALWMMREMGLSTATFNSALLDALAKTPAQPANRPQSGESWVMGEESAQRALALVIAAELARADKLSWPAGLTEPLANARQMLADSPQLFAQAALALTGASNAQALNQALQTASESEPTIDRALALAWLARGSGLKPNSAASTINLALPPEWKNQPSASAASQWQWAGSTNPPAQLNLSAPSTQAYTLAVRYDSHTRGTATLPASISRTLYRMERRDKGFEAVRVSPGEALSTTALYMDELRIEAAKPLRYALLEVALPPGAFMEASTWGVNLAEGGKTEPLERTVGEATRQGYSVPLDNLSGSKTVRHLVRFAQKGQFTLPASRVWRMYQPEAKAYEAGNRAQVWTVQ